MKNYSCKEHFHECCQILNKLSPPTLVYILHSGCLVQRVHDFLPAVKQSLFRLQSKNKTFLNKSLKSKCFSVSYFLDCSYWEKKQTSQQSKKKKRKNVTLSVTPCSSLNPSHNIAGLGDSYTVFQECRLKFDMPEPSKHNSRQKPQRITHNQSPKEFPWTQLLTRKLCTGGEGRRAAATPDLNSMNSTAGDRLRHSALWLVPLLATTEIRLRDIFTMSLYWQGY